VRPIINSLYFTVFLFLTALPVSKIHAQENSPYSRYGLGDLLPSQSILNRAMGGLTSAYSDYQAVNFSNPASYTGLKITTLEIGLDYTSRALRSLNPPKKFTSANLVPSYLQIGLPLSKKREWGMNIGMRPVTRISYDIFTRTRVPNVDSIQYKYVGNGGTYQAFVGMAYGVKSLSVGFNAGYMFGIKEYSTRVSLINDTVAYKSTMSTDTSNFGGMFLNLGIQYRIKINKDYSLRLGASANLKSTLKANRNISRETIDFSPTVGIVVVDSIYKGQDQKGEIIYPSSWTAGFMIERNEKWMAGAEINVDKWGDYRYYGEADKLKNSFMARVGGQFMPDNKSTKYWNRVVYSAGFMIGTDPIFYSKRVGYYAFTFGTRLPVRRSGYTNQYTTVNTAFEIGFRGNKTNEISENIFRFSLGLNLSDVWFIKRKYE
jgi:hypothetical protein